MTKPFKGDDPEENLASFAKALDDMVASALFQAGQELKNKAVPLTPMDTGALRRSLYATLPKQKGKQIVVEVGADGRSAPYALAVHEKTGSVNWSEPGTGAKYLERPFNEMAATLPQQIATEIARMIDANRVPPVTGGDR